MNYEVEGSVSDVFTVFNRSRGL